jgi:hypothetical protein
LQPFSELRDDSESSPAQEREGSGGGEVDMFGRSLSERVVQDTVSVSAADEGSAQRNREDSNSGGYQGQHIATANSKASEQFLENMMHNTAEVMANSISGHRQHDKEEAIIPVTSSYEAPIMAIKFSREGIVDPSFLENRVKGQWKKMCAS